MVYNETPPAPSNMSESSSSGSQENAPSTSRAASGETVNNVHNSQPPLNTQLPPMTPQVNVNHSSHLPKLNLPTFSDNPLNWSTFWDSFKAAVHSTTTLGGVPFKCPKGGAEARKEYYNFKNFYSIVLVALVDAKYRFMWESCGLPGNSHNSIIFQSTSLWEKLQQGTVIPNIGKNTDGVHVFPAIVADLAFQFSTCLTKPYTNAILSQEQRYFNYCLWLEW